MVTSNKLPEKKVVRMTEQVNSPSVPQRTLLGVINEHITCRLCRGYYIDATTIVECLHSFCRSCIIKHLQKNSYCPVCEMMINSAKPNIKLDKALQDIVYKLVPGLFQKEMDRRRQFYASRPGTAAAATPEQRGEDTERIIFSPEDVISFSLEFIDATDADSISSKSSDSNESQVGSVATRRFLQCPAVVNISHLKKFLSMKFDIDSTQFAIDILYKRVQLADYYTLMDVAYIYNWKRNEPMRFYYQIIDRVALAMRSRLFDINRKDPNFQDKKSNLSPPEDININSPTPNVTDQVSEASSGTDSPMPEDRIKKANMFKKDEKNNPDLPSGSKNNLGIKKVDEEVEKSQFLNSFELTAKSNGSSLKSSPVKDNAEAAKLSPSKDSMITAKLPTTPVKSSIEIDKSKSLKPSQSKEQVVEHKDSLLKNSLLNKIEENLKRKTVTPTSVPELKKVKIELEKAKLPIPQPPSDMSKKNTSLQSNSSSKIATPPVAKTVSPLKLQMPKIEPTTPESKPQEMSKPQPKKIPDLRPAVALAHGISKTPNKPHTPNKIRMDLLSNNCDPTNDRSKMLSQVKVPMSGPPTSPGGDPLKSLLFDSCKINIPSSLSITLTDQKQDARNPDQVNAEQSKPMVNKNLAAAAASNTAHKAPSPPVHNYIEILKLPDSDPKKNQKASVEPPQQPELNVPQSKPATVKSETSAKGPVPNLKPISDTKLPKQGPVTFQQTFEQQILSAKADKNAKPAKTKPQVPKLMPATPKTFGFAAGKMVAINKSMSGMGEQKSSNALDLSSAHNVPLGPQQSKAFETMQSIANLAKKQASMPPKGLSPTVPQANMFSSITNRPLPLTNTPLRIPVTNNASSNNPAGLQSFLGNLRQEIAKPSPIKQTTASSAVHQSRSSSPSLLPQPSPRQTRSPSSSPKLVIAEDKQSSNSSAEHSIDQSNMISSSQVSSQNPKTESPKSSPGPSRPGLKPVAPTGKITGNRQPITPTVNKANLGVGSASDFFNAQPQMLSHHAILRHQMDHLQNWYKAQQRQYDLMNNRTNAGHPAQKDFGNKDKQ